MRRKYDYRRQSTRDGVGKRAEVAEALSGVELEGRWDGGNGDSHRCCSLRMLK
jgi:hypothetical protein